MKPPSKISPSRLHTREPHLIGVLFDHEGRISATETEIENIKAQAPFGLKDLLAFLPGLVANALALALLWGGKISALQWLGFIGAGK